MAGYTSRNTVLDVGFWHASYIKYLSSNQYEECHESFGPSSNLLDGLYNPTGNSPQPGMYTQFTSIFTVVN